MRNPTGFLTLIWRECYRFVRLSGQTIAPPVLTTLLFIFIFGFSLGSRIREIAGVPYVFFILPGLAVMGVINNSYANTSTSLFMARMDRSVENLLACPLSSLQLVTAFVMGGLIRGLIVGWLSLTVGVVSIQLKIAHWPWVLAVFTLASVLFSSLGLISALWSESWDQIASFTTFILTPLIYLGGVFYSIHMLPAFWQKTSLVNPIFYLVDAMRYGVLGHSDVSFSLSMAVLFTLTLCSFLTCVYLFKKGYKLKH